MEPMAATVIDGQLVDAAWHAIKRNSPWPELDATAIHVFRAKYPDRVGAFSTIDAMRQILNASECARADRFHAASDRDRFVFGRGLLRIILAGYLGQTPAQLEFSRGRGSKPMLVGLGPGIQFNVSHSGEWLVIAVAHSTVIGVDIEHIRDPFQASDLARRYFAPEEQHELARLSEATRGQGFFNAWTRKEAYVKAVGAGLQHGLDRFAVSLAPGEPTRFLSGVDARWQLLSFMLSDALPGALVYDVPTANVVTYDATAYFRTD
jgi:4'-phosphopantetheinyl transferase